MVICQQKLGTAMILIKDHTISRWKGRTLSHMKSKKGCLKGTKICHAIHGFDNMRTWMLENCNKVQEQFFTWDHHPPIKGPISSIKVVPELPSNQIPKQPRARESQEHSMLGRPGFHRWQAKSSKVLTSRCNEGCSVITSNNSHPSSPHVGKSNVF